MPSQPTIVRQPLAAIDRSGFDQREPRRRPATRASAPGIFTQPGGALIAFALVHPAARRSDV